MGHLHTGASLLAIAQLLPLVCSMLGMVMAWVGLQRQFPIAQALQLLHPLTPVLFGIMTVTSQVRALPAVANLGQYCSRQGRKVFQWPACQQ
jgi:hypothetical protein